MSVRTPLSRVEGLGAAHEGPARYWKERTSAAALIPLTIWFFAAALHLVGEPLSAVTAFLVSPVNATLTILFILATVMHMTMGVQVVIEDYIHEEGAKVFWLLVSRGFGWLVAALCLFAVLKIAFTGSV